MVIAERYRDCASIYIFSSSGEKLRSFGTHGPGNVPCGVAVDGEGNILVADINNHRVQKFTPEGQFLTAVGTGCDGRLQFDHPRGLTFNA